MRSFRSAALGFLGAAALAAASDVHELNKDTFGSFVKDNDLVLAECKYSMIASTMWRHVKCVC